MAARKQIEKKEVVVKIPGPRVGRKQRIAELIEAIEDGFKEAAPKATLADFIRLTQLERELEEEEQPGEIIIRWADPEKG
jgi:hypothetical protein